MKFRNISTGEQQEVHNLKMQYGRVFFSVRGKGCGTKFFNKWKEVLSLDEQVAGGTYLRVCDGWEIADEPKVRKPKAPKEEPVVQEPVEPMTAAVCQVDEPQQLPEPPAVVDVVVPAAPAPAPAPKAAKAQPKDVDLEKLRSDIEQKYGQMGADIFTAVSQITIPSAVSEEQLTAAINERMVILEQKARASVIDEVAKLAVSEPKKMQPLAVVAKNKTAKQYYCKDFEDIKQDVADGFNVYLYGAAGSGKTHTAEQIAEALGLDFYTQTTIQFAHDVRGYGDAGGNYVDTPFYKAFSGGGLYFQDEYDRSYAEAAIVLNTALANGYYDFPVVGRVKAHPNFRFMAAGNTLMKGADIEYVTGQCIDASSRDRFGAFYECEYNHDVELNAIAGGDKALVEFVEDVRQAIKQTGITHIVSYRATAYMVKRQENKVATLIRNTFKGLLVDDIRMIYNKLSHKSNVWAKAMQSLI